MPERVGGMPVPIACPSWLEVAPNVMPFALMTMFYVCYFQGTGRGSGVDQRWGGGRRGQLGLPGDFGDFADPDSDLYAVADAADLPVGGARTGDLHLGLPCGRSGDGADRHGLHGLRAGGGAAGCCRCCLGRPIRRAMPALMILALSIPVRFVQTVFSSVFVSERDMLRKSGFLAGSAFVGLTASVCLVPYAGPIGAAIATVLAETVLLVLHIVGVTRFIPGINTVDTFRMATFRSALGHLLRVHTNA